VREGVWAMTALVARASRQRESLMRVMRGSPLDDDDWTSAMVCG
jgi:hypothetical protein